MAGALLHHLLQALAMAVAALLIGRFLTTGGPKMVAGME
jgi:hypothetical protein